MSKMENSTSIMSAGLTGAMTYNRLRVVIYFISTVTVILTAATGFLLYERINEKIKPTDNADDNSSVSSLSYNYFDEMAQSYCAASRNIYAFAIRRNCAGIAPTCNDICNSVKNEIVESISNIRNNVTCYDALSIGKNHQELEVNPGHTQPDVGVVSMATYGYGPEGCSWAPNHCGPNCCCCKAF